jgi:hypothetical protein
MDAGMSAAATAHLALGRGAPAIDPARYVVRVMDRVDERIAGHDSCAYASPPQPRADAVALARLLLGGTVSHADGSEPWTRTVAVAGGRRTVTLERVDGTR